MIYVEFVDYLPLIIIVSLIVLTVLSAGLIFLFVYKAEKAKVFKHNLLLQEHEEKLNKVFEKRLELLAAFDVNAKKLDTPNLYSDISIKVAFKKETDKYIKSKKCRDVLMNNNAELAQIVNEYNNEVVLFNKLIKRFPDNIISKRYGYLKREIYDENKDYNKE